MASSRNEKLHQTVLTRCLPTFVRDLDINAIFDYLSQENLLDDITLRDILEQTTTSDKVWQLIYRLQQRDQHTYEKFKECLVLSKQEHLKQLLEEEEGNVAAETGACITCSEYDETDAYKFSDHLETF